MMLHSLFYCANTEACTVKTLEELFSTENDDYCG